MCVKKIRLVSVCSLNITMGPLKSNIISDIAVIPIDAIIEGCIMIVLCVALFVWICMDRGYNMKFIYLSSFVKITSNL